MRPHPETVTPGESFAADQSSSEGPDGQLPFQVPPILDEAQEAFRQALPRLLVERAGQWVAFQGRQLIGFAATDLELHRACVRQGYQEGHFLVRSIEPEAEEVSFGLRPGR
jgi:hypothetical protein